MRGGVDMMRRPRQQPLRQPQTNANNPNSHCNSLEALIDLFYFDITPGCRI